MRKELMMALAAAMIASPAMANEHNETAADKTEKVESKVDHVFAEADTDKNGSISKAEHDAVGDKMWTEADANKDGSVSRDEMIAAKKAEMEKWKNMKPDTGNH